MLYNFERNEARSFLPSLRALHLFATLTYRDEHRVYP